MKKRIVATLLLIAMLAVTLIGCNDEYTAKRSSANAMTVVIAMVSEKIPTAESIALVEKELTSITSQVYNIAVELEFYTPDQYRATMDDKLAKLQSADIEGTIGSSIISGDSYTVNEFGREEIKYLDPYENQVDIFLVSDPLMLRDYANNGWLYGIGGSDCMTSVDGEGTLISSYIPANIREFGNYNGSTYAIPGNSLYGEYEYLLVNKALYNRYGTLPANKIENIASIKDYLISVAEKEQDAIALYNISDAGFSGFSGRDSVVGRYMPGVDQSALSTGIFTPVGILSDSLVSSHIETICKLDDMGAALPTVTDEVDFAKKFGACYVKGNPVTIEEYTEDYYAIPVCSPVADTESVFSSMYGVCSYSSAPDRAFKVLSLFSTNEGFVNTLLYGVQNVHYTLDITGKIVTKVENSGYEISRYSVGNLFLTKQSTDMSTLELELSANGWALAKKMAGDAILSPYIGFELDYTLDPVDGISVADIDTHLEMLYDELWFKVASFSDALDENTGEKMTFEAFYKSLNDWLKADKYYAAAMSTKKEMPISYYNQYMAWHGVMTAEPVIPDLDI